jgi:hypothetical protein
VGFDSRNIEDARELSSVSAFDMSDDYKEGKLMTDFETFIAVCKCYCAINILILPKNFSNGGYIVGIASVVIAGALVYYCALKLILCAIKIQIYSYR